MGPHGAAWGAWGGRAGRWRHAAQQRRQAGRGWRSHGARTAAARRPEAGRRQPPPPYAAALPRRRGQATTLRRNGSDFSATILGALFQSGQITIWTDVDGVYSADPRKVRGQRGGQGRGGGGVEGAAGAPDQRVALASNGSARAGRPRSACDLTLWRSRARAPRPQVPEAVCLPGLTYHEAWELSYFGANVLHPRTTLPAMKYDIPITIRNYFNLDAPGGCRGPGFKRSCTTGSSEGRRSAVPRVQLHCAWQLQAPHSLRAPARPSPPPPSPRPGRPFPTPRHHRVVAGARPPARQGAQGPAGRGQRQGLCHH
jgi:hypothetical protein